MSLFLKECKAVLKSPVYLIYAAILCLFFFVMYIGEINNNKDYYSPPPDTDTSAWDMTLGGGMSTQGMAHPYGMFRRIPDGNNDNTIKTGLYKLLSEYLPNNYRVSRLGGMKNISLSEAKQKQIYAILLDLCGADFTEAVTVQSMLAGGRSFGDITTYPALSSFISVASLDVNIDDFNRVFRKIGNIIGGQNDYQDPVGFASTKIADYEEALTAYNNEITDKFFTQDGVSGGMARLFADRMGIVCLILAGMVSIFYLLRDKKSWEVLSSKSISSVKLYATKYISLNAVLLLPVLILAMIATIHAGMIASEFSAARFDILAFFNVSVLWILPTIMFSTAFAMLITCLTDIPVASVILAGIWFLQATMPPFTGVYGLGKMLVRFNSELSLDLYRLA
jgi:ABC-type transport system involved in multi-copper enzyme maturation permease subunit